MDFCQLSSRYKSNIRLLNGSNRLQDLDLLTWIVASGRIIYDNNRFCVRAVSVCSAATTVFVVDKFQMVSVSKLHEVLCDTDG